MKSLKASQMVAMPYSGCGHSDEDPVTGALLLDGLQALVL